MDRKPFNIQDFKSNEETPVETRDGRAVEIKSILDADYTHELYPIRGCIKGELYSTNDYDVWTSEGKYNNTFNTDDFDLFFVNKEKIIETKQQIKLIPFDITKAKTPKNPRGLEIVTRDNNKVEILTTNRRDSCNIVTLVEVFDSHRRKLRDVVIEYFPSGKSLSRNKNLDLFLKQPVKSRRMTNKELSWWLKEHPEEHRENMFKDGDWISSSFNYNIKNADEEVSDCILIRSNGGSWREPLIEIKKK